MVIFLCCDSFWMYLLHPLQTCLRDTSVRHVMSGRKTGFDCIIFGCRFSGSVLEVGAVSLSAKKLIIFPGTTPYCSIWERVSPLSVD